MMNVFIAASQVLSPSMDGFNVAHVHAGHMMPVLALTKMMMITFVNFAYKLLLAYSSQTYRLEFKRF